MKTTWEESRFSSFMAWNEPGRTKTYQQLNDDIQSLPIPDEQIWFQEDQTPYQNALMYLSAWKSEKSLCLIPKSWPEIWKNEIRERLQKLQSQIPRDCFYLLPTSGSTGHPKLVVVSRDNWKALMQGLLPIYPWAPGTRVGLSFEGGFDPFIAMLFLTLSQGGTLFPLLDSDKFDIFSFLQKNALEVWASVPSLAVMNWPRKPVEISRLPSLRHTLFTGEVLTSELVGLWRSLAPASVIENLYGPVEATVWATRYRLENSGPQASVIPIGQPLAEMKARIQDEELILMGPQVALGYLSTVGLESFGGVYHTGDRIEEKSSQYYFMGRKDQQVKIRGQRIELEAIEATFFAFTGDLGICCVDANQNLCFMVQKPLDLAAVFDNFKAKLPLSHIPRSFYLCPEWPRTASGKMDRQSLLQKLNAQALQKLEWQKDGI